MNSYFSRFRTPKTPLLQPQVIPEEDDMIPDFFLDDDAGVGSSMDYNMDSDSEVEEEDYEQHGSSTSLSTILAYGCPSPCASPAPSLVSDCSNVSESSDMFMPGSPVNDVFKFKKMVRFLPSVDVVPFEGDEQKSKAALKPPQEPLMVKVPGRGSARAEDVAVMYGLGRAGSPRSAAMVLHQKSSNRTPSPPRRDDDSDADHSPRSITANATSSDSDSDSGNNAPDDSDDDSTIRSFRQIRRMPRRRLLVPLYPAPAWRETAAKTPAPCLHTPPLRIHSPSQDEDPHHQCGGYEEDRYVLGSTSPTGMRSLCSSPDGVARKESALRESYFYNHPAPHYQSLSPPLSPVHFLNPAGSPPLYHTQHHPSSFSPPHSPPPMVERKPTPIRLKQQSRRLPRPVMSRSYWRDGEMRYEDQWGRRLVQVGHSGEWRFELAAEDDGHGEEYMRNKMRGQEREREKERYRGPRVGVPRSSGEVEWRRPRMVRGARIAGKRS